MPTVTVNMYEGRTLDQKRALAKNVTKAVMDSLGVPASAVTIWIEESKKENHAKAGVLVVDEK
jgi:4-oxalocrotonate tautomerase